MEFRLVLLLLRALWHDFQAMPRPVSGALVLPLRGRVEATSEPSCPIRVRQAPSTSIVFNVAATRESAIASTVASPARLLQGRGLLARAASLESLLAAVPPQRSGVGCFCSADVLISRRQYCIKTKEASVLWIEGPKVLPFTRTGTRCTPESVCRSIQEPSLPNLTSAPRIVSLPLRRCLLTSLCTKGVLACNFTRPPGPKTSCETITFLPKGIERPSAFLHCTFEGPRSRPPSAKFHGQVCSS